MLQEWQRRGAPDLEAGEWAVRETMLHLGGRLLEKLLGADGGGYQGIRIDCGRGHEAQFEGYRDKQLLTVLGALQVRRASYHCPNCGSGVVPKDGDLDMASTSFSPGVRRMMGRVGAKEPFEEGQRGRRPLETGARAGVLGEDRSLCVAPGPDDVCGDGRHGSAGPALGSGRSAGQGGRAGQDSGGEARLCLFANAPR